MNYLDSMNYTGGYPSSANQNMYAGNIAAGAGVAQQQMQTPNGMQSPALTVLNIFFFFLYCIV